MTATERRQVAGTQQMRGPGSVSPTCLQSVFCSGPSQGEPGWLKISQQDALTGKLAFASKGWVGQQPQLSPQHVLSGSFPPSAWACGFQIQRGGPERGQARRDIPRGRISDPAAPRAAQGPECGWISGLLLSQRCGRRVAGKRRAARENLDFR